MKVKIKIKSIKRKKKKILWEVFGLLLSNNKKQVKNT